MLLNIVLAALTAIVLVALGLAVWRARRKAVLARRLQLSGPNTIDEAGFVPIGGIDQWVTIRGEDRGNPVLLVVHGGPGSAFGIISHAAMRPWEARYTVVHWDQRGAGRTFGRNGPRGSGELSLDRMASDGVEVVRHALVRTGQAKLILLGASWGSILGLEMVRRHPELYSAFVGAGQVVDMEANEAVGYEGLAARLQARGKTRALARLAAVGPPPYPDLKALTKERRILMAHPPRSEQGLTGRMVAAMLTAPGVGLKDLRDWLSGMQFSLRQLYGLLTSYRDTTPPRPLAVPLVIIQGEEDIQTPTSLARDYFERLDAPAKRYVEIPGGGHMALIAMPDAFLAALEQHVRPLTAS